MLRWFITAFTLHFCLCLGVSAVGKSAPMVPGGGAFSTALATAWAAQQAGGDAADAAQPSAASADGSESDSDSVSLSHALLDDADDLSDEVNLLRAVVRSSGASYPRLQWTEAPTASHAPATPRKPPRSSLSA